MKYILAPLLLFFYQIIIAQTDQNSYFNDGDSGLCITHNKLLQYFPFDSVFQVVKPALRDLVSSIQACGYGYTYNTTFADKNCQLLLPYWMNSYSLSFGNNDFFISLDDQDTASADCIVLYYGLANKYQSLYYHNIGTDGQQFDSLIIAGKVMYTATNNKGIYAGEILLGDNMSIAYYTGKPKMEQLLRTCILSCTIK